MTYAWRGLSLDIARSFFGAAVLTRVVDRLAGLGLNRLHLHLTDDQGWRLAIPGRPELTELSGPTAVRGGQGGYLTVAEWTNLVEHAAARGVTVVPEIDLPGHVGAALHAVPALNPDGRARPPDDGSAVGLTQLDPDLPATAEFLHDVLTAVAALTPGPWLHIGGDECPLLSEAAYAGLVRQAAAIVRAAGKIPVAWQEAALAGPEADLTLQFWSAGEAGDPGIRRRLAASAARLVATGAPVILSPAAHTYFDHKYSPRDSFGQDWAGTISVEEAGGWVPEAAVPGLDPARIVGLEAALWTESIHDEATLDRMLWPRLEAFSRLAA
ncbi:MAG: family 20 glycosylhydrolase [Propionibacteriaceae bacterium]|jgi:hexosaminidase|nr:family 20 glycosylhydrolase [Propionibacteriaceae bacterium]